MAPAAARVFHGKWQGAHKMDVDMRPEVVSTLLSTVEAKWVQEARDVLSNQTEESIAFNAMESSCVKVSTAVVQGADGDRDRVVQYMQTVCNEPNAKSNIAMCKEFANAIQEFMIGDNEYNREKLQMHDFCQKFWSTSVTHAAQEQKLVKEEKKRLEAWAAEKKREADEEEEKQKLAAEAAQKAAYEAEEKKLAEMAQEAEAKRKLAEAVAKNSTSLTAATQMNLRSNQTTNTPQLVNTSTSATASTVSTENKTETLTNATAQKDKTLQNVTVEGTETVKNQTQAMENFSPKLALKNSSRVDTASNNQSVMNSTLKVVLKNTSAVVVNQVQTTLQGNLTQRVRKHLKFILNHTKNVTA